MALGQYLGAGSGVTKTLLNMNGDGNDSSGNAVSTTTSNVTWVAGLVGSGAGDFVTNAQINWTQGNSFSAFTISVTFVADSTSNKVLFCDTNQRVFCQFKTAGGYDFATQLGAGPTYNSISSSFTPTTGVKYNFVFEYTGSVKNVYIDGRLDLTTSGLSGSTPSGGTMRVGVYEDASYGFFDGRIDEFIQENVSWGQSKAQKQFTYQEGRYATL